MGGKLDRVYAEIAEILFFFAGEERIFLGWWKVVDLREDVRD